MGVDLSTWYVLTDTSRINRTMHSTRRPTKSSLSSNPPTAATATTAAVSAAPSRPKRRALSDTAIAELAARPKRYRVADSGKDRRTGLVVEVQPGGGKVFLFRYESAGRDHRLVIGAFPAMKLADARKRAGEMRDGVREGEDPAALRASKKAAASVAELMTRYAKEHGATKAASSQRADESIIRLYVLPSPLAAMKVAAVRKEHVAALLHGLRDKPIAANRTRALLSKAFALAEEWGLRADKNPCTEIKKHEEVPRDRYLSALEYRRLFAVLDRECEREDGRYSAAAIRLLVLTGMRLGEVLGLRWADVDLSSGQLALPVHKTSRKTGKRVVEMNDEAIAVLSSLPRAELNPFVIVGRRRGRPIVNLEKPWRRIRLAAGIDDVRIHDLRHSFASAAIRAGASLPMIGRVLGHTSSQTTARYSHVSDDVQRETARRTGSAIMAMVADTNVRELRAKS